MGGFFGVVSEKDCSHDLFYGVDYHSHLGTKRGGLAVFDGKKIKHVIHNIENTPFRSKFEYDLDQLNGNSGIGCISDKEAQPLTIKSSLGLYSISTVGKINNIKELSDRLLKTQKTHFFEMSSGEINQTELVAAIINNSDSFESGINEVYNSIDGSISILILADNGIYAARDRLGRTPIIVAKRGNDYCVTFETCAIYNLGFSYEYELGPNEVVFVDTSGIKKITPPREEMQMCAFLWVYYGFAASTYEGRNVEEMHYESGRLLAHNDEVKADIVAGVPDSGTSSAIGYSLERNIPFSRPFMKYTPTWARSFMPQNQSIRDLVAKMKLIPVADMIKGKKIIFCEDSIVRGTQMLDACNLLYSCGAEEVHMRVASPPIVRLCKFLNFSSSTTAKTLITERAIKRIEGGEVNYLNEYCKSDSEKYNLMIEEIRKELGFKTLKFIKLEDVIEAIGLPEEKICTYCFKCNSAKMSDD